MPLYEVVFKVTHDCPFGNISRRFPSLKMFLWCNREYEVIEILVDDREEYSAVMEEIVKIGGVIEESSDRDSVHIVTKKCFCTTENSVSKNIDAFNLLHVSPVVYERGWEYYRIIVFRHKDLKSLLQRLEEMNFTVEIFERFLSMALWQVP